MKKVLLPQGLFSKNADCHKIIIFGLMLFSNFEYPYNSQAFMSLIGAITFALILQKFRLRLSYTCAHKSGAFALSFGVTLAPVYSQIFLSQLLVFEPRCKKIGLRGSIFLVPVFSKSKTFV